MPLTILNAESSNKTVHYKSNTQSNSRIESIDIFRALTMLMMIFVNDIASVKDLPYWTYHIGHGVDNFTYVDMVFPTFLFIVGLSIPLAIRNRQKKKETTLTIVKHIVIRTLSLLLVGVLIINGRAMSADYTGISYAWWNVLMFVAVFLIWNIYPKAEETKKVLYKLLRILGFVLLGALLLLYRREDDGTIGWMQTEWWGILGLIGFSYCASSFYCLLTKQKVWAMFIPFVSLLSISILVQEEFLTIPEWLNPVVGCVLTPVTIAGVIVSLLVVNKKNESSWLKLQKASIFAVVLFALGYAVNPYGINGGNPSWTLYSSAIATTLFLFLYMVVDVYGKRAWTTPFKPLGNNTLLAYLLPDVFYAVFTIHYASAPFDTGGLGAIRAGLFAFSFLGITWIFTRLKIRLQL